MGGAGNSIYKLCKNLPKKKYQISKTNIKPKIDGYLDDITWKNLNTAKDFTQIEPRNGEKERNFQIFILDENLI